MKKLLIVGNELHATRYISSLLFVEEIELSILKDKDQTSNYSRLYNIEEFNTIKNQDVEINEFDYIIYTVPNGFGKDIYELLKNYEGCLLLEKPQLDMLTIKKMKCRTYFIHLRSLCNTLDNKVGKKNYIDWPNLAWDGMDEIINTVPNVVDYINGLYEHEKINDSNIYDIEKFSDYIQFRIELDKKFLIKIYNTKDKTKVPRINGEKIKWPNYFETINKLGKEIVKGDLSLLNTIEKEQLNINIIKKIRGEINGYKKHRV